jgi:hypothetical protein
MHRLAAVGLGAMLALISGIASAQAKVKPQDVNCPGPDPDGTANRCRVNVEVILDPIVPTPAGKPKFTCRVNAPDVNLKSSPDKGKVVLVWDLPNDYEFCPVLGDGVFLVNPDHVVDEEFDDLGVPDTGVGLPTFKKCRNRFRMLAENQGHSGVKYSYRLQFRNRSEKLVCTADPFIKNG